MKGVNYLYNLLVGATNASDISTKDSFPSETQNILLVITPQHLPGWSIIATSSHSRRKTQWWQVARCLFQEASLQEKTVLRLLTVGDPEHVHEIVDFATSTVSGRVRVQAANLLAVLFPELTERFLASFQPRIKIFRFWTEIKRIPPKRFVGVGYNDHGSLASTPSWKEQMLSDPEQSDVIERVRFILSLVNRGSPPSLVGYVRPQSQAEESLRGTKRKG